MRLSRAVDRIRGFLRHRFPPLGGWAFRLCYHLFPNPCPVELFPGIRVDLKTTDDTQKATYWQGERFEWPTCPLLERYCRPPVTRFFDIGSNYGFFSYFLLSPLPHLQVAAFEPNPETFEKLRQTRERNGLTRLDPQPMGVSDFEGEKHLYRGESDSGHSTFFRHPELPEKTAGAIPIRRFDRWLESRGISLPSSPEWVAKIDVEGSECGVLRGMTTALQKKVFALLVVELNDFTLALAGDTVADVRKLLTDHGYREIFPAELGYRRPKTANAFFVPA